MTGKKDQKTHSNEFDGDEDSSDENKGLFGEALKKVFTAGVGAAFMTEESIRAYLAELKLPKEFLNLLLSQANRSKEELMQRVSREMMQVFNKIDIVKEVSRFAETHRFKITAEVEITRKEPKGGPLSPSSSNSSSPSSSSED